jgi:hypothetical protein
MRSLFTLALLLALASPALATTTHCTAYEQKTMNQLHTLCDDGTRAISIYNRTLQRWETTITASPRGPWWGRFAATRFRRCSWGWASPCCWAKASGRTPQLRGGRPRQHLV